MLLVFVFTPSHSCYGFTVFPISPLLLPLSSSFSSSPTGVTEADLDSGSFLLLFREIATATRVDSDGSFAPVLAVTSIAVGVVDGESLLVSSTPLNSPVFFVVVAFVGVVPSDGVVRPDPDGVGDFPL